MIGNTGKFWISADPYVDVEGLKSLHVDLALGIALSCKVPSLYAHRPAHELHDLNWALEELADLPPGDPIKAAAARLRQAMVGCAPLEIQAALYHLLLLTADCYSGGFSVVIRSDGGNYLSKNDPALCSWTENAPNFTSFRAWLEKLPFAEIGRIHIFVGNPGGRTLMHSDALTYQGARIEPHLNEHLWLRTNLARQLYLYDEATDQKHYVTSHAAFFNEKDWHGSEPDVAATFAIRVDGKFKPEFREQLGIAHLRSY